MYPNERRKRTADAPDQDCQRGNHELSEDDSPKPMAGRQCTPERKRAAVRLRLRQGQPWNQGQEGDRRKEEAGNAILVRRSWHRRSSHARIPGPHGNGTQDGDCRLRGKGSRHGAEGRQGMGKQARKPTVHPVSIHCRGRLGLTQRRRQDTKGIPCISSKEGTTVDASRLTMPAAILNGQSQRNPGIARTGLVQLLGDSHDCVGRKADATGHSGPPDRRERGPNGKAA